MTSIAAHEQALAADLRRQLVALGGVTITGPACPDLGVVSFGIDGVDHRLVAAMLGYEHGIGVRSGCFCAQPYVHHLLQLSPGDVARWVTHADAATCIKHPASCASASAATAAATTSTEP